MAEQIYEVKFEIPYGTENGIAEKLGLKFVKEYEDTDSYLRNRGQGTVKLKFTNKGEAILYTVVFDGDCFDIRGKEITEAEKNRLLRDRPVETVIHRRKRVYSLSAFGVKADVDYMKQFPRRLFLEIHAGSKEAVMKAKGFVEKKAGLRDCKTKAYDALLREQEIAGSVSRHVTR